MQTESELSELMPEALQQPKDAIFNAFSRSVKAAHPDAYILETEDHSFNVPAFAYEGQCELFECEGTESQWETAWNAHADDLYRGAYNAWFRVKWGGNEFLLAHIGIMGVHYREVRRFLIAESQQEAEDFFRAVCKWTNEIRGEILVFDGGCWSKSADLFKAIKISTLEGLILPGTQKEDITRDFEQFFQSEGVYDRYRIPWKRGVLFLGPPGNGKTHMIKALINHLGKPALYVRPFRVNTGARTPASVRFSTELDPLPHASSCWRILIL